MTLRTHTDFIGGAADGQRISGHCSRSEARVPTASRTVFRVYEEQHGKLVFQGYHVYGEAAAPPQPVAPDGADGGRHE